MSDRKDSSKFVEEPATAGEQEREECMKSDDQTHNKSNQIFKKLLISSRRFWDVTAAASLKRR